VSRRGLTTAETALARQVFGDTIAYDRVRIFNRKWWPFQPKKITMAPDGNLWFHPDGGLFCDDFCGQRMSLQGLFIHEMTHVWQHQRGVFLPLARHPFCQYAYDFVPGKPFGAYGIEQQAEIARHYFMLQQGIAVKDKPGLDIYRNLVPDGWG
jgi:hypothetical protein